MTLEEAIKHVERMYKANHSGWLYGLKRGITKYAERCKKSMDYNRQLAEWLRELQERRKQPEIIRCKDCAHYHTDVFGGELGLTGIWKNIIVAHNACDKWTKHMNCVEPEGFCFLAERRTDE